MSNQQLALQIDKPGDIPVVGPREIPNVPAGEVLIKILATALNPADWKIQDMGFLSVFPAIPGTDLAGEVETVGAGVTKFKKGDRVMTQGFFDVPDRASFQQYTLMKENFVAKIPASLSYEEAATIPMCFVTAAVGLFAPSAANLNPGVEWLGHKQTGQTILIIGGSTSVGQYVVQLAKFIGFTNIIVYASKKHHTYLTGLGATQCIDRSAVSLDALADAIPGEVDLVYDAVMFPEAQDAATNIVRVGGKVATVSNGADMRSEAVKEASKDKHFYMVAGGAQWPGQEEFCAALWERAERFLIEGIVKPNRHELLPGGLRAIVPGLERLKKDEVSGVKLVVRPHDTEI
ncbi:GroES-like protein [Cylindrobasidium torrendii FP15055 ss-10]|uniref:GroES-like protein n=1 Tax=Cylindrobasidium torrendii FP15055 ss-10 TaxID=1314674 RepID=A0A0D7BAV8_9AGAR|nr:GroES-like protein [Cylindrobasidium torrendii FP15055 ss-10]